MWIPYDILVIFLTLILFYQKYFSPFEHITSWCVASVLTWRLLHPKNDISSQVSQWESGVSTIEIYLETVFAGRHLFYWVSSSVTTTHLYKSTFPLSGSLFLCIKNFKQNKWLWLNPCASVLLLCVSVKGDPFKTC